MLTKNSITKMQTFLRDGEFKKKSIVTASY